MTTGVDSSVFEPYCKNDMRLLRSISKSIFLRLGESLTEAEYDDFYSIANITLFQAYNSYNPDMGISFDVFLRGCLKRKFKTEIRDRHREKRVINQFTMSLDATTDDNCSTRKMRIFSWQHLRLLQSWEEKMKRLESSCIGFL